VKDELIKEVKMLSNITMLISLKNEMTRKNNLYYVVRYQLKQKVESK